jgi:hypothetical protein
MAATGVRKNTVRKRSSASASARSTVKPAPGRTFPKVKWKDLKEIYEVLGRRYSSGDPTVSARHNEHQP